MVKRYVQSIHSNTAPLFELDQEYATHWIAEEKGNVYSFLKSEYHEVPAPERWERVAGKLQIRHDGGTLWLNNTQFYTPKGYRWAWDKQEDGTLCIERKVEP